MQTHYVLIDCENVQPDAMARLEGEHFRVKLFVGASQSKISLETAAAVQHMGKHAEYVRIVGNGHNALDFHIAYYIGRLSLQDPTACFHIVSRDTGFDPLIAHLKAQKFAAIRSESVGNMPLLKVAGTQAVAVKVEAKKPAASKAATARTAAERLAVIITNLQKHSAARPRRMQTLKGSINNLFKKALSDPELDTLVKGLVDKGLVSVTGEKVSYALDLKSA